MFRLVYCANRIRHVAQLSRKFSCSVRLLHDTNLEEMDQLKTNPYFAKYAEKFKDKEQQHAADFEEKVTKLKEKKEKELEEKRKDREDTIKLSQERRAKGLDGVVKLDLLRERSAEEVRTIWLEHHEHKQCIYGVLQGAEFDLLHERLREFPAFLYPLPRGQGYQFMLQQFENNECHFTPLALYQEHKENAPQCLTIRYFTELQRDKGIVLMNSEVNTDLMSVHEAQLLALQVKMYYGVNSGLKFNYVRLFKNAPSQFEHIQLVLEFEKYKQDLKDHRDGTWV